jgi:hypothetical protein
MANKLCDLNLSDDIVEKIGKAHHNLFRPRCSAPRCSKRKRETDPNKPLEPAKVPRLISSKPLPSTNGSMTSLSKENHDDLTRPSLQPLPASTWDDVFCMPPLTTQWGLEPLPNQVWNDVFYNPLTTHKLGQLSSTSHVLVSLVSIAHLLLQETRCCLSLRQILDK